MQKTILLVLPTAMLLTFCNKIKFFNRLDPSSNHNTELIPANSEVQWYSISKEFKTIDGGRLNIERAHSIVEKYIKNQDFLDGTAEDAVAKSLFGFSRKKDSFLELSIDNKVNYRVKHETPILRKSFMIFGSLYQREYHVSGKDELMKLVESYFKKDSESFIKYFDSLGYRVSN